MSLGDAAETTRAERIETLLWQISQLPDERLRAQMEELVQSLLDLFGDGLARILTLTEQAPDGADLIATFARDDLVGSLLLLYDLHPDDLVTRVMRAVEGVRGVVEASGSHLELLSVTEGVARVRLSGGAGCRGCAPSGQALQEVIEKAIIAAAPDLEDIQITEVSGSPPPLITLTPRQPKAGAARSDVRPDVRPGAQGDAV